MLRSPQCADNAHQNTGRVEGQRRKDANHTVLDAYRKPHLVEARRVLLTVLLDRGLATADDVRDKVTLPTGVDPRCFGSAPKPFILAGIIRCVGRVASSRPVAHGRENKIWELIPFNRPAAERWLAELQPEPSAVENSTPLAALEALPASRREPAPIVDIAAETSPATLPSFGRNDRPADVASPGGPSSARVQRSLFDANHLEGLNDAA